MVLKKRQKEVLAALAELDGEANALQIAEKTGFDVNGVSQSLSALGGRGIVVCCGGGNGGECRWKLYEKEEVQK